MNKPISISIIIPAHNSAPTLDRCLESLRIQDRPADEIVVVDDASDDQTPQIGARYGRLIKLEHCLGAGGARNRGAREARGSVYAFIDSDCVAPGDWLKNIEAAFQSEEAGAVAGGYSGCSNSSYIGRFAFLELVDRRRKFQNEVRTAVSNNFAVRANLFWSAGGFPESFSGASLEDMVLSYRISRFSVIRWLEHNGVIHHFPDSIYRYFRQQFAFGRDTVAAYATVPGLLLGGTHQGRKIYLETALTGAAIAAGLLVNPVYIAALCVVILLMNYTLLSLCRRRESFAFAARTALFLPARDALWCVSVLWGLLGLLSSICGLGNKRRRRDEPLRAYDSTTGQGI